jgi:hypothetical protein
MSLVSITNVGTDAELLDAHLAFHLNAGVDAVIIGGASPDGDVAHVLEPYVLAGHARQAEGSLTELGRLAVAEYGAEWVFPSAPEEFWWPRAKLPEVLAVIRRRVVQALTANSTLRRSKGFRRGKDTRVPLKAAFAGALARILRPLYERRRDRDHAVD